MGKKFTIEFEVQPDGKILATRNDISGLSALLIGETPEIAGAFMEGYFAGIATGDTKTFEAYEETRIQQEKEYHEDREVRFGEPYLIWAYDRSTGTLTRVDELQYLQAPSSWNTEDILDDVKDIEYRGISSNTLVYLDADYYAP